MRFGFEPTWQMAMRLWRFTVHADKCIMTLIGSNMKRGTVLHPTMGMVDHGSITVTVTKRPYNDFLSWVAGIHQST